MGGVKGNTAVYLLPGMKIKLSVPNYFKGTGTRKIMLSDGSYVTAELTNGFWVEKEDVGTIDPLAGEPAVVYTHKKFAQNRIVYFSKTGEIGEVDVMAVPIHDHSSVVTGGPAYGTYFTDDETVED
jgi:hypothetical protein